MEVTLIIFTLFIFGLVFGSFFNVVGYRLPKEESIVSPPSHCPVCNHKLTSKELIPVLSYLIQKGKCANCKSKIGVFYPTFEFLTGVLFVLTYLSFGLSVELIIGLIFVSSLIIIIISDYQTMIIPDEVIIFALVSKIIYSLLTSSVQATLFVVLNGLVAALFIYGLKKFGDYAFKKESMGGGDIKLLFIFGLFIGFDMAIISIFLSSFIALPYSIYALKKNNNHVIPFGPFLSIAALIIFLLQWDFMTVITFLS